MEKTTGVDLHKELQVAQRLARHAGKMVLDMQGQVKLDYKPHGELVTEADILADQWICRELSRFFPYDAVVAEESHSLSHLPRNAKRIWFVDPIDGTAEYVRGGQNYVVMIGLAIEGVPRMGVIFQPSAHVLWRAQFHSQRHLCICERVGPTGSTTVLDISQNFSSIGLIAVGFHAQHLPVVKKLAHYMGKNSRVLHKPSVGLKFALVAEGKADLSIGGMSKMKLWDSCAPAALLLAAGGHVCSPHGTIFPYGNQTIHQGPVCGIHPCYMEHFSAATQTEPPA